jgi:simple sugar transport system substrate-binding protein/ribose transport system substrate-binding protein
VAACAVLLAATALTGCNRGSDSKAGTSGKVGIDMPRTDTDFWNSYQQYLEKGIKDKVVSALPLSNSQNDISKLVANVQSFTDQGAKAVVMAPQDTGAIASTLDRLAKAKVPVISVDTRPDKGDVYMVVRADNRAYGTFPFAHPAVVSAVVGAATAAEVRDNAAMFSHPVPDALWGALVERGLLDADIPLPV